VRFLHWLVLFVARLIGGMDIDSYEDAWRTSHLQAEKSGEGWTIIHDV
jgi:hypothetical protein